MLSKIDLGNDWPLKHHADPPRAADTPRVEDVLASAEFAFHAAAKVDGFVHAVQCPQEG
jgi:hypothetical protein